MLPVFVYGTVCHLRYNHRISTTISSSTRWKHSCLIRPRHYMTIKCALETFLLTCVLYLYDSLILRPMTHELSSLSKLLVPEISYQKLCTSYQKLGQNRTCAIASKFLVPVTWTVCHWIQQFYAIASIMSCSHSFFILFCLNATILLRHV